MPVDPSNPSFLLKFNEKANFALLDTPEGLGIVNGFEDNGLYNQMIGGFNGGFTGWNYFTPSTGEDHNDWAAGGSGSDTLVGDTDGDLSCVDEDDPSKNDDTHSTDTGDVLYGGSGFFLDRDGLQAKIDAHDASLPADDGKDSTQPPSFDNTAINFQMGVFDLANVFANEIELGILPNFDFAGDELIGGRDNDTVFGQAGNDTIDGGGGSDYLFGGRDNDLMDGDYLGNERDGVSDFTGNIGTFELDSPNSNGFPNATFEYDTANYRQDGAACDDGDAGDFMFGGRGKDTMYGGDDSVPLGPITFRLDEYLNSDLQDVCLVNHGVWNYDGDFMRGGGGRDTMNGEAGFDTMYGNWCNDEMRGSYHYDLMFGGKGSDLMFGGTTDAANGGEDTGDFDNPGGFCEDRCAYEGVYDVGENAAAVAGADLYYRGGDTMFGGRGHDTMHGGAGDDLMYGGRHNDCMYGGNDDDRMLGQGFHDFMSGGNGWDDMSGGKGYDTMNGDSGDDYMDGDAMDDTMGGGTGNDYMHGGTGNDLMSGDGSYASGKDDGTEDIDGNSVSGGRDFMYGEDGMDNMAGNGGNDVMYGGDDMDVMTGDDGNDCMDGGAGRDSMEGGEGNDTLIGGTGVDTMIGGDGDDVIYINGDADENYDNGEEPNGDIVPTEVSIEVPVDLDIAGPSTATLPERVTGGNGEDTFVYSASYFELEDENGAFYSTATGDSGYVVISDFEQSEFDEVTGAKLSGDVLQLCISGDITECCIESGDENDPKFDDYPNINERLIDSLSTSDIGQMGIRVYDWKDQGTIISFDDTVPNGQDPSEPEFHNDEYIWLEGVTGYGSENGPYTTLYDLYRDGYDIRIANSATLSGGDETPDGDYPQYPPEDLATGWSALVDCEPECPTCDIDPFSDHPIDPFAVV